MVSLLFVVGVAASGGFFSDRWPVSAGCCRVGCEFRVAGVDAAHVREISLIFFEKFNVGALYR